MLKNGSNKGFSLVELMVVVAIIGILAAIAIPSVSKYMAKARQSEAKAQLSSMYTAQKAFFAEYSTYDTRFGAIGYSPEGQLRYNVGFSAVHVSATAANGYNTTLVAGAQTATNTLVYCPLSSGMCTTLNGVDGAAPPAIANSAATVNTFTASATARIFKSGTAAAATDTWTIDQVKVITNTSPGIQ